jgi:hypothetical protein
MKKCIPEILPYWEFYTIDEDGLLEPGFAPFV